MQTFRALGIALALLGLVGGAEATGLPKITGKYSFLGYHICQTVIHTPTKNFKLNGAGAADAVASVDLDWNAGANNNFAGILSVTVGTVTFPSPAASSGTVTMSTVEVLGHSMRDDNPANVNSGLSRNPATGASTSSAAFSFTSATTLKVGADVYDISVSNLVYGIPRTINMVRRPKANEYCMDASTLTQQ